MEILNLFKYLRDHFGITIVIVTHEKLLVDESDVKYSLINGNISIIEKKLKPAVKKISGKKSAVAKKL